MQYSKIYASKAQKAIDSGLVDLKSFIEELRLGGAKDASIERMLLDDLENEGPIFGKFFRSLGVAGDSAITLAEKQAASVYESMVASDAMQKLREEADITSEEMLQNILDANPEELEQMDQATEDLDYTWICKLQKTCAVCLPLHGKTLSKKEWQEKGLVPGAVHNNCQCDWVLAELAASRKDLVDPLVRIKITEPETGTKKTIRGVTQISVDKAREAALKASQSEQGRRTLRLLGQVNNEED